MTAIVTLLKNRPIRWSIAILWTTFISILLVQSEAYPLIVTGIPPGPSTLEREIFFTTLHFIAFGVTCAIWFWTWFGHLRFEISLILAIVFSIAIGTVTEYLQTFSPDRLPSLIDLLANCLGASLMAYFIWRKQHQLYRLRHQ